MKTHPLSPRAAFRALAALLVTLVLLFAAGASAQSTNWLTGVNVFSNAVYGTPADNDVVDNATLIITNGGALTANQLNVGPTNRATLALDIGGALTVNQLLATNVVCGGVTNSLVNFNSGTLITSNAPTAIAATILIASNANLTMNSSWSMNGGTNIFSNVATNGAPPNANLNVGSNINNVQINVNTNAVWWNAVPANSRATNNLAMFIGIGNATNNVFTVNGGTLIATNYPQPGSPPGSAVPITVGQSVGSTSNQLAVLNGGQVVLCGKRDTGNPSVIIGLNGSSFNSLLVAGTNGAGRPALLDCSTDRLNVGNGGGVVGGTNNWLRVDAGGIVTNANLFSFGMNNYIFVTNGGQLFARNATIGRTAVNNALYIAGADSAGNLATLSVNASLLSIGGGSTSDTYFGTNTLVWVGQGGVITNVGSVTVGNGSNAFNNSLIITNGGQVFSKGSSSVSAFVNANSNYVIIGGSFGPTNALWSLGNTNLVIGNNQFVTNSSVTVFSGGVLTNASSITFGGVNSLLNVSGGTLALTAVANGNVLATNTTAVNPTNLVASGGVVIIDTVGFSVTNQLPLQGGGSLTKLGSGTLAMLAPSTYTGGSVIAAGTVSIGNATALGASGTVDLTGNGALQWGGGINTDLSSRLKLEDGITATFDTGTNNVTLGTTLPLGPLGTAGLTKAGTGTLTLGAANTNTGPMAVSAGTLIITGDSSAATGAVTVSSYATLGGAGTLGGNVTLAARASLMPGGYNSIGTLSLTNNLTLNGGTLYFSLSTNVAAVSDALNITNNLTLSGTNVIVLNFPNGPAPAGTYTLMTYAATNGPGTIVLLGNYPNAVLNVGLTSVTITVAGGSAYGLTWFGGVGSVWTTALNWTNGAAAATYVDGDAVTFDDSASANFIVTGGSVSPGSVTFNNTARTYTNSAAIGGTGSVVKLGAGAVTLSGSNTFSGGVTLNAGTLRLSTTNALGTGLFTINGGILDATTALLLTNNNAQLWNNDFTFTGTANLTFGTNVVTLGANSAVTVNANTLQLNGAIVDGAANGFTKLGAGTLALNAASTYSGPTIIGAGSLTIFFAQGLGATAGGTTVSNGATLKLSNTPGMTVSGEPLTLSAGNIFTVHLQSAAGSNVWTGPITVNGTNNFGRVEAVAGASLTLSGPINVDTNNAITPANGIQLVAQGDGSIFISGNITNIGGFIRGSTGLGVTTLSGTNSYTGKTDVTGSTLLINGDNSAATGPVTISQTSAAAIGTLGGSGIIGGKVFMNPETILAPGGTNNVGKLTLTNTLGLNGNKLFFDLTPTTNDSVAVGAVLGVTNVNIIYLTGSAPAGTNTLFTYGSLVGPGSFVLGATYGNVTLITNANKLQLVVTGTGFTSLTWKGNLSGNWDTAALNWTNGVMATNFATGNDVVFDDTLSGNPAVTNSGTVLPGSVTVYNNLTNYALKAAIGGSGGITKVGSARLTLSGTNSYTGATMLNAGTLVVTTNTALGTTNGGTFVYCTGSLTNGGILSLSNVLDLAEPITLAGPGDGAYGLANFTPTLDVLGGTNTLTSPLTIQSNTTVRIGAGAANAVLNLGLIQRSPGGTNNLIFNPLNSSGTINVNAAIQNPGGAIFAHASGSVLFNAPSNNIGDVNVQYGGNLKITVTDALATNRNLLIGGTTTTDGAGAGTFYLLGVSQTINSLNGQAGTNALSSFRKITSTNSNAMTLTVGMAGGGGTFDGVIENGTGIGGTIAFTKVGAGTQIFTGNLPNTYTGLTTINGGVLQPNKLPGTNAISGNVLILAGTLQHLTNNQIADTATVIMSNSVAKWDLNSQSETVANVDMQNAGSTANNGINLGVGSVLTINGYLNHVLGDITLSSGGTGSILTVNTMTNLGGSITYGTGTATPNGMQFFIGSGGLVIGGGSTFLIASAATATNFLSLSGNLTSLANAAANNISDSGGIGFFKLDGIRTFNVASGNSSSDLTISARITNGATAGGILKTGAGILTLSGRNFYTGPTVVSAGTLILSGVLTNSAVTNSAFFTENTSGVIGGAGGLVNSGIMILNGTNNSYTGATVISNGILTIAAGATISNSASITIAGGTLVLVASTNIVSDRLGNAAPVTLGGSAVPATLALVNTLLTGTNLVGLNTETVGSLTIAGSVPAAIDFGNGTNTLRFADSSAQTWATNVLIVNWSGLNAGAGIDQLFIGSGATLTVGQLAKIIFVNPAGALGNYTATQLGTGEVVPNTQLTAGAGNDTWNQFNSAVAGGIFSWNQGSNWLSGTGFPNATDAVANVNINITNGNQVINLNQPITVGALYFGDPATNGDNVYRSYTINSNAPGATLTFDVSSGRALLVRAATTNLGSAPIDTINANVVLNDNLDVIMQYSSSANGIYLNGAISGAGGLQLRSTNMLVVSGNADQILRLANTNNSFTGDVALANGRLEYFGDVLPSVNGALGNSANPVRFNTADSHWDIGAALSSSITAQMRLVALNDSGNYAFGRDLDFSYNYGGAGTGYSGQMGRETFAFGGDGVGGANSNTLTFTGTVTLPGNNRGLHLFVERQGMTMRFAGPVNSAIAGSVNNVFLGYGGANATNVDGYSHGSYRFSNLSRPFANTLVVTRGQLIIEGSVPASGSSPIGTQAPGLSDGSGGNIFSNPEYGPNRSLFLELPGSYFARTLNPGAGSSTGVSPTNGSPFAIRYGTNSTFINGSLNVVNGHVFGGLNTSGTVTFSNAIAPVAGRTPQSGTSAGSGGSNEFFIVHNLALIATTGGTVEFLGPISGSTDFEAKLAASSGVTNGASTNANLTRITINQFRNHPNLDVNQDGLPDTNALPAFSANGLFGVAQGGTVILSGTNTYSGTTEVLGGTLLVNTAGGSGTSTNTVIVTNGATLGGAGVIGGNVVMAAGTTLAPGGSTNMGTLTLSNNLTLNGGVVISSYHLTTATNDKAALIGALNVTGTNYIVLNFPAGSVAPGTYTLMTMAATNGAGALLLANGYTNVALNVTATNVTLVVSNGGTYSDNSALASTFSSALTWKGYYTGIWDDAVNKNWLGSIGTTFSSNNAVTFDDSLVANATVVSAAPVFPASVTFSNNTTAYTINAAISGSGGLTKNGTATLSLNGSNSYSGVTLANMGILAITNASALGATNGNTVIYHAGGPAYGGQLSISGGITLAEPITITGPGESFSNVYSGAIVVNSGSNNLTGTITLTNMPGTRIQVSGTSTVLNPGLIQRFSPTRDPNNAINFQATGGGTFNHNTPIQNNGGNVYFTGGPGTNVLNVAGSDIGDTLVQYNGLLKVMVNNALSTSNNINIGASGTGGDVGYVYLEGVNQTINALIGTFATTGSSNAIFRKVTSTSASQTMTLTVGSIGGGGTYNGVIENGSGGGKLSFIKMGSGTQVFSGNQPNTYTGNTTISNGVLQLGKSDGTNSISGDIFIGSGTLVNNVGNQIADTATVTLNNTNASWNLNGMSETVANVNLQSSAPGTANGLQLGQKGTLIVTGTFNQSGGDLTMNSGFTGSTLIANAFSYSAGLLSMGNGNLTTNGQRIIIGAGGLTISGGGSFSLSSSTLNNLSTNFIYLIGDLTSLAATNSNMIYDLAGVDSFKLDSIRTFNVADGAAANDLIIAANIADGTNAAGIIKTGAGTLLLSSNNTYTGATTVSAGSLIGGTGGSCSNSLFTVSTGATNGVSIQSVGGQWTCSNLVYTSGNTLDFNFNSNALSAGTAPLRILNNLDCGASLSLNLRNLGQVTSGVYPLLTYAGAQVGTVPATATLPGNIGGSISNDLASKTLYLVVTNGNVLFWAVGNGAWDINTTLNWKDAVGTPQLYLDPAFVTFDDSASGSGIILVTNAVPVNPVSVTANLTNKGYTISGNLINSSSLTKSGTNVLTLAGTNTYAGNAILNGGTVAFAAATNSIAGTLTFGAVAGSTNASTLNLGSGSLTVGGALSVQTSNGVVNNILIGSGQALKLTNAVNFGTIVGANPIYTTLKVAGAGTLKVGDTNAPTGQNVTIGGLGNGNAPAFVALDLSGLGAYYANLGTGTNFIGSPYNTLYAGAAAQTNRLATNSTIVAAALRINSDQSLASLLAFGAGANEIDADYILLGNGVGGNSPRSWGTVNFNSTTGTLKVRARDGVSRTTLDLINTTTGTGGNVFSTVDLSGSGHSADLFLGTLTIAGHAGGNAGAGNGSGGTGTLSFDNGSLDATNVVVTRRSHANLGVLQTNLTVTGTLNLMRTAGSAGVANFGGLTVASNSQITNTLATFANGTVNIGGGTVTITNTVVLSSVTGGATNTVNGTINITNGTVKMLGGLLLANNTAATSTNIANLNLTGGTLTLGADLTRGGGAGPESATNTLNGGTLDLGGFNIGSLAAPITNVFASGTLKNVGQLNGGGVLTKTTAGTLTLDGASAYTGATIVSAGKLVGLSGGSISNSAVTVAAGATNGVRILAADGQWFCGGLTNAAGGTLELNYNGANTMSLTAAPVKVLGDVNLTGVSLIVTNVSGGALGAGAYPLVTYTGTLSGTVPGAPFAIPAMAGGGVGIIVHDLPSKTVYLVATYTLTYSAGANGSLSGAVSQTVPYLTSGTQVTAVPNSGYLFAAWSDGVLTSNRTDIAQIGGTNVTASFVTACTSPVIVGGISASATTVGAGGTVTLTLTNVTGSSPLNYQWRSNTVAIAGATGAGYTTPALWVAASGSSYDCVVTNGCDTITSGTVSVTVTQAVPGITILSSAQTNGYHDSVYFTATNLPAGATSNVVFTANGVAFSTNNLVNGGTISLAITNLPRGATNSIAATYSGDVNYLSAAASLTQTVTNHIPTANVVTEVRTAGLSWHIVWTNLATNWTDVDGDVLAHSLTNLVSTNGVTLTNNGTMLLYPASAANVNDRFYYTINDLYGGTNTGYVDIVVDPYVGQPVTGQVSTNAIGGVPFVVTYYGIPGYTYNLQRNTNLVDGAGWVNITTNTIGGGGVTNVSDYFGDLSPIVPAEAYYRVLWHP